MRTTVNISSRFLATATQICRATLRCTYFVLLVSFIGSSICCHDPANQMTYCPRCGHMHPTGAMTSAARSQSFEAKPAVNAMNVPTDTQAVPPAPAYYESVPGNEVVPTGSILNISPHIPQ